jgi:hypothetical protein
VCPGSTIPVKAISLAATRVLLCELPHKDSFVRLQRHRRWIRTGICSCVAHLIGKGARRAGADAIGIEAVITRSGNQGPVSINADATRRRTAPGEISSAPPGRQVSTRTERNLARCRSCHSRCGGRRGRRGPRRRSGGGSRCRG